MTVHNLPLQPYKKFFGRSDSIEKIKDILLDGGTYIASVDGVGGIGKTALAYFFCKEFLLQKEEFDFIIWITAKQTVFDSFSNETQIKDVNNNFDGINSLIDLTLKTVYGNDSALLPSDDKLSEFENIVKNEKIFFVFDNLETINDDTFFEYIKNNFNKFSRKNRDLKVLTTSRIRKKIVDNPIEIEGLTTEDALTMLKYLAQEKTVPIKSILNGSEYENMKLIEKVGKIPIGIEFIVGQLATGKSRQKLFGELEGYPDINYSGNENTKKKMLSEIIYFCFKDMFENLDDNHKKVFQIIAAYHRQKSKNQPNLSIKTIFNLSCISIENINLILNALIDNKLITEMNGDYYINQMAINFVRQYYEDFSKTEEEVAKHLNASKGKVENIDDVSSLILSIKSLIDNNELEIAKMKLEDAMTFYPEDYRLYFELAKIFLKLKNYKKASDNFKEACNIESSNFQIWLDWSTMEYGLGRKEVALKIINDGIIKTNYNYQLVVKELDMLKNGEKFEILLGSGYTYAQTFKKIGRSEDLVRLLFYLKDFELIRLKGREKSDYFKVLGLLIDELGYDFETKRDLINEGLENAKILKINEVINAFEKKLTTFEQIEQDTIQDQIKKLNKVFQYGNYPFCKKEAKRIVLISNNNDCKLSALRILLQILASEKDYKGIINYVEEFSEISNWDESCLNIYNKAMVEGKRQTRDLLISEIKVNIESIENNLRDITIKSFNNSEKDFINFIEIDKNSKEWIEKWQTTRLKGLNSKTHIIYFSDFSELVSIFSWIEYLLLIKIPNLDEKKLKEIKLFLNNYIIQYRNQSCHHRFIDIEDDEINTILTDTKRTSKHVHNILNLLGT